MSGLKALELKYWYPMLSVIISGLKARPWIFTEAMFMQRTQARLPTYCLQVLRRGPVRPICLGLRIVLGEILIQRVQELSIGQLYLF